MTNKEKTILIKNRQIGSSLSQAKIVIDDIENRIGFSNTLSEEEMKQSIKNVQYSSSTDFIPDTPKIIGYQPEFLKVMIEVQRNIPLNRHQVKTLPMGLSITSVFPTKKSNFNGQVSKFIKQKMYYNTPKAK